MTGRLGPYRAQLFGWAVTVAAFSVCYVATVRTKPLFAPDTRYYAGMALWFGGTDKNDAARQVAAYSARSGWESPNADVLFGWGLVQPRVVFPALAAPFVKVAGIPALAVVSGVALLLLVVMLLVVLGRRWGTVPALGAVLLVVASPQLMFYGAAMLTESLSALWGALTLAVAWRYLHAPSRGGVVAMVALTVVSGFTRQATLIAAGAFVTAWLCAALLRRRPNPWRIPALAVGASSVGVQLLQMWLFPGFSQANQFMSKTGADSLTGAILGAPELAWHIFTTDLRFMATGDRALLVFVTLAGLSMVLLWRRAESHLLLGAILGTELYNITNGTPTVFRYAMPGLVFFAASVAMLIAAAASTAPHRQPRGRSAEGSTETPTVSTPRS